MNSNSGARLYVCETRGEWAAALRRAAKGTAVRVHDLRSPTSALAELAEGSGHVIVWQVRYDNLDSLPALIHTQSRQFPSSCALVVGDRKLTFCEWACREAGAVHAVFGMRDLDPIIRIAMRHLAKTPAPAADWQTHLEQQLPWPAVASPGFRTSSSDMAK